MSNRRNRGNVEHAAISNLSEGVASALEKVQELNNPEPREKEVEPASGELRDLVLFGKVTKNVTVGGYTFKLSTLSNKQQKSLVKKLIKLDNEERLMNVKEFTLAEAIVSVNDQSLSDLYSGPDNAADPMSDWSLALEVLSEMQSSLIEHLYDNFESLVKDSKSLYNDGRLGDQVKN